MLRKGNKVLVAIATAFAAAILLAILVMIFFSPAYATDVFRQRSRQRVVQKQVNSCGHVQQVVVDNYPVYQEQVYYFVGQPLRVESLLRLESKYNQEALEYDRFKQEYREFQSWRLGQRTNQRQSAHTDCPTCQNAQSIESEQGHGSLPPAPSPQSIYVEKCSKCHSGNTPKGQLTLTPDTFINLDTYRKAVELIDSGKMPKGGPPLSSAEADRIKSELLGITQ